METWGVVFLGVIAAASAVQAAYLIGLARAGRQLASRLDELQQRIDRDVRPALEQLSRVSSNLGDMSDIAARNTRRAAESFAHALDRLEEGADLLQRFLLRPLGPLVDIMALLRGLQRGIEVYRHLGAIESQRGGAARRYRDDEHLFI